MKVYLIISMRKMFFRSSHHAPISSIWRCLRPCFLGVCAAMSYSKLDDGDIDLKSKTIRLRETKGGRDDIIYINQECVETLQAYLKIRPQVTIKDRIPLFYTDNLNFWERNDVHRMLQYYKKRAGIKTRLAILISDEKRKASLILSVCGRRANVYAMLVLWPRTTCFFSSRSLRCL